MAKPRGPRYCGRCGVTDTYHGTIRSTGIPIHDFTLSGPPYPDQPPLVERFLPSRLRRFLGIPDRGRDYR
jgi:hypothetical protein